VQPTRQLEVRTQGILAAISALAVVAIVAFVGLRYLGDSGSGARDLTPTALAATTPLPVETTSASTPVATVAAFASEPDNALRFGAEAVGSYVREWAATFDHYRCEVDDLIERGDSVVAAVHLHGRIGTEGGELSIPLTQVWTISDGKVTRVREYRTTEEALEAVRY